MLVIAVGNPSRGDDAVGPLAAERLARELPVHAEILTDFQLQVEHSLDLRGRSRVLFVDASASLLEPFALERVEPRPPAVVTTHALSPAAVLHACGQIFGESPECWLLAIRGESFELGAAPSPAAAAALDAALVAARAWLRRTT